MADTRLVLGVRVLASWPSISTSTRKFREGGKQARRNPRELGISELVGRVTRCVIVSIAMECRIRDHDGAIALAPKRPMIAPRDSGNKRERRRGLEREIRICTKRRRKPPHCCPRTKIRNDPNEIRPIWIKQIEQWRIALTARLAAVPPDGLDRRHEPYVVSPPAGRLSVHRAPLSASHEEWRLLVDECNEPDGQCRLDAGEETRDLEKGRDAARIIIGARAAGDRVVVRADQKDFTVTRAAAVRDFEVQATNPETS
jgi:hypothetical protein